MFNEVVFIGHMSLMSLGVLGCVWLGKEALVSFICVQAILANLFILKQISLFGFSATCADAYTIGTVLGLNMLQEYYGKESAQKAIWISFFMLLFYGIISQLHLMYMPLISDHAHDHYSFLLTHMPRIIIASFSVYLFAQHLDAYLYGLSKKFFENRYLIARNYISVLIVQLVDTVLFSFLGLYGIVDNIADIIMISYGIKVIALLIATPFLGLSRYIYRVRKV